MADLILSFKGSESFVIGVEGAWGAGKTSFINMVLETLGNRVYYFVFNPWNFSDQTSLLKDFSNSFSNIEPITSRKDLKNKLTGYAKKLSDYGFQGINLSIISFNPFQKLLNESLGDIRDGLNKSLGGLEKKVVIVIDDIDRLDADETKLIFKLVKLTAQDIANFAGGLFARSPRLRLGSLRIFPYILGLNQTDGQNQKSQFYPAGGGSALQSNAQNESFVSNFFLSAFGGIRSQFFNPPLFPPQAEWPKATY